MLSRILRIALIPLLLLALTYEAYQFGDYALGLLMDYQGPVVAALPSGPALAPVSGRVVVVVVDALREDTSRQMPAFQRLREQGADLPSWAELPSLSHPGYVTLGTGAYPDFSGVASNWYVEPVRVDSLFAQAQAAGLKTAIVAGSVWDKLYGPWLTASYTVTEPPAEATVALGASAQQVLQQGDAALVYIHFGETDEAGHAAGGGSPEYLAAALHVDDQIAAIAGMMDWSKDTLILTADHGMSDNIDSIGGGHGGGEDTCRRVPVVMVGRGITPGVYPDGGQADIVPTIAVLLGLPIPAQSQGRARLDVLVLTPQERAGVALNLGEQQKALYTALLQRIGARTDIAGLEPAHGALDAGSYDQVPGLVDDYLKQLDNTVARARANRTWQERVVRLPYLLVPLLVGAAFVALYKKRGDLLLPVLLMALFFVVQLAVYMLARGGRFSFTDIGGLNEMDFFMTHTLDALLVMIVVAIVAGIAWRRGPWEQVVWSANLSAAAIAWAFLVQLGLFLWLFGLAMTWRLPDLGWGFKFYLDMLALVGVGAGGFLLPWLALGVSRLFLAWDAVVRRMQGRKLAGKRT